MSARTLEVRLGEVLVGHLTHYPDEKTFFVVDRGYLEYGPNRPVLSLSMTRPGDEDTTQQLLQDERQKSALVKAPPYFSNLLPEGGMRARIAAELKVHEDREFDLLAALGSDLPGAVVLKRADTPEHLNHRRIDVAIDTPFPPELKASLAGMQVKFSMLRQGEHFTFGGSGEQGHYILKPPSNVFEALPLVEAATMAVAKAAGIETPDVRLVDPAQVEGISNMHSYRQGEPFYAIRRFDRLDDGLRRHSEDFAQVFNLRINEKYGHANYEQIARTLLMYAGGLDDVTEMSRRLILNVLLGNGDAHIKNWSLLYEDPRRPRLAPAYDLVSTIVYTDKDDSTALNMNGIKRFRDIGLETFEAFLKRTGVTDQYRDAVMHSVTKIGKSVLEQWEEIFQEFRVPPPFIEKIHRHLAELRLLKDLKA